jgi:hypothetical protein
LVAHKKRGRKNSINDVLFIVEVTVAPGVKRLSPSVVNYCPNIGLEPPAREMKQAGSSAEHGYLHAQRILVVTDLSDDSMKAIGVGKRLAQIFNSKLTLMYVYEIPNFLRDPAARDFRSHPSAICNEKRSRISLSTLLLILGLQYPGVMTFK